MAFCVEGPFKMSMVLQQRMNLKHPFSTYFLRMSSSSTSIPPDPRKRYEEPRNSGRNVIIAVGSLVAVGGLGFIYKTYTDDNFTISSNLNWFRQKIGWEETKPKLVEKLAIQKDIRQKPISSPKTTDNENIVAAVISTPASQGHSASQKAFTPNDTSANLPLNRKDDENNKYYESELHKTLARQAQVHQERLTDIKAPTQQDFDGNIAADKIINSLNQEDCRIQETLVPNATSSNLELKKKIDENREYYENELLKTLARQAQVYQENLAQIKATMQEEFDRKLKQKADIHESESLVELRAKSRQASAALDAMVQNLKDRKNQDDRTENLRKLWSYCSTVYGRINYANFGSTDDKVFIRKDRLLKEFSGDEFAMLLLKTIPDVVRSSESLKERFFNKIDKTCRQVAIFKVEEKITLWKYFFGYIQGNLVTRCDGDKATSKDVYELLDRTGYYLRRGEILEAVVTLSKLKGLPGEVCKDWLNDAVSVLEASQTLYALMAHVNANSIH